LEGLELLAGVVVLALAGIHDPLKAVEGRAAGFEGVAECGFSDFRVVLYEKVVGGPPKIGFDAAQAAEAPFVVDQGIDEETLVDVGRAVEFVVLGGEFGEIFGGFAEHYLLFGIYAVLQGVVAGFGFALGGDGALGLLAVGPAGCALFASGHKGFLNDDSSRRAVGAEAAFEAKRLVMSGKISEIIGDSVYRLNRFFERPGVRN
jgi:hypothetical protein